MKFPDNLPTFNSRPAKGTVKGIPVWADKAAEVRWRILGRWAATAQHWGFAAVETPLIEERSVFVHAVGEHTDIVHKEMFAVQDPKSRHQWVLRPEGTAPIMRARVNGGQEWQRQRVWYHGPMFRYERPQHGRLRQFTQFGIESYAPSTPAEDLQTLLLGQELLSVLPDAAYQLEIGALGCPQCRPDFRQALVRFLEKHAEALCSDCRSRIVTNPLRTFDCKVEGCREVLAEAPSMQDYLCESCGTRQKQTMTGLQEAGLPYLLNRRLVRGLDYYNGLVFEWTTDKLGAQSAIAAGGRYDGMSALYGKEDLASIGFAIGLERVLALLEANAGQPADTREPGVYWVYLEPDRTHDWYPDVACLRQKMPVECDFSGRSLKACLRSANRSGWRWAIVTGETERQSGEVSLRDLQTGESSKVRKEDLVIFVSRFLEDESSI